MGFMGFLSFRELEIGGWCRDCTHAARRLTRFSGPGHYCSANHPLKMAARVGLAPTPCGLTNRRATLTPPGNGAAGRIPTCIVPFRRRMPDVFGHDSNLKLARRAVARR